MGRVRITKSTIDPADVVRRVMDDSAGGTVVFIGSIRSSSGRHRVERLQYEVYKEMAEQKMREIEAEVKRRWPVKKVSLVHREGILKVGEVSVVVAVSSKHRAEAFEACRYAIDRIKRSLPLWKKEKVRGIEKWVEGTPIEE